MRSSLISRFGNWRSTMKISGPCGIGLLGCSSLQEMAEAKAIAVHFEDLVQFLEREMRMSHVYQPVMLRLLLGRNGRASIQELLVRSSMRTAASWNTIPRSRRTWLAGCWLIVPS